MFSGFLGAVKGDTCSRPYVRDQQVLGRVMNRQKGRREHHSLPGRKAVKVIDGPFNGFNETVEEILEDKKKLKVMVKIFGRKTLLELGFVQ
jgi:transcriptional antiterminator NusG